MQTFQPGDLVRLKNPIKDNDSGEMVTIDLAVVVPSLTSPTPEQLTLGVDDYVWIRDLRSAGAQRHAFVTAADLCMIQEARHA